MPDGATKLIPPSLKRSYWKLRCPRWRHRRQAGLSAGLRGLLWRTQLRLRRSPRPVIAIGLVEHVGDIIAAEPIARSLRRRHPEAFLIWAVRRRYRELVETNPHIDAVLPVTCLTEWMHLARSHTFESVIDLHMRGRCCETCWLLHDRIDGRTEITIDNYYDHGNLLQIYSRLAGIPYVDDSPRMYLPPRCRDSIDRLKLPDQYVVVHATSNQAERDWHDTKWQQLVRRTIQDSGTPVVEIGLRPIVEPIPGYRSACGRLSLLETAEVIRRASLFVGIDSGPAHMANAVGTPGVILLGHYRHWHRYMPYSGDYANGANAEIVYGDGPASTIAVDEVFDSVRRSIARPPSVSAG